MIYYQDKNLLIRSMEIGDGKIFHETYLSYGWDSSIEVYENYYIEQEENKRRNPQMKPNAGSSLLSSQTKLLGLVKTTFLVKCQKQHRSLW